MEEQQQQEQPKEPTLAELGERIAKLEEYITTRSVPTFTDIYRMLATILQKARAFEAEVIEKATKVNTENTAYLREVNDKIIDRFRGMEARSTKTSKTSAADSTNASAKRSPESLATPSRVHSAAGC